MIFFLKMEISFVIIVLIVNKLSFHKQGLTIILAKPVSIVSILQIQAKQPLLVGV